MVKANRKVLGYWLVLLLLTLPVFAVKAQEMKEAADLYNAAATTYKQNPAEALKSVQQSIAICDQLDTDEAKELKAKGQREWHHLLSEHKFEQTQGDSEEQRRLACCSSWGHKELDTTK